MIVLILLGLINAEKSHFWLGHENFFTEISNLSHEQRENCEVSCAIWEEVFEDIDDALKHLKAEDDIIKSDLTRTVSLSQHSQ